MQNSVSIVIPSYNLGALLRETIASIEAVRTPSLREVIIVDDGSTDPTTLEVLKDLEKGQYLVMRQPNRGVGAARNAGIRVAQGEFILPVDSDNRIRRTYLAEGPTLLHRDQSVGVVYGDAEYFGDRTGRWRVPQFDLVRLVDANFLDTCALFRKRVWEDVGGYDEHMPHMGWEDWDFWLRAAVRGWRFVHLAGSHLRLSRQGWFDADRSEQTQRRHGRATCSPRRSSWRSARCAQNCIDC